MGRPSIGLLCDLPRDSGIGKYGAHLQRLLQDDFELEIVYFNYGQRRLESIGSAGTRIIATTWRPPIADNKPWFWHRLKGRIPGYDLTHIISQNLSFLLPEGSRNALVTCHDIAPLVIPTPFWERWGRRHLYSGLSRARTIVADSQATRKDLMRICKIPGENIRVIPLGVDCALFRPRDRQKSRKRIDLPLNARIVLNVSIDKWRKNLRGLVRAVAIAATEIPDLMLLHVGSPSPETSKLVRALKLEAKVRHLRASSEDELVSIYCAADLFAFPSFYEGFGLPVLEAMACGIPVVASSMSAVPEVVGRAGILVDPKNVSQLAEAIARVLDDKKLAAQLSALGLERSAELTWERTAQQTAEAYGEVLDGSQ